VPLTFWAYASALDRATSDGLPLFSPRWQPLIVRSASPTEDQHSTSNAGQFVSVLVRETSDIHQALLKVIESLPVDNWGQRRGAVFVQPFIEGGEAGVAFFDGFYYERTLAKGRNEALTAGQERGQVSRSFIQRGEPWSQWLLLVH